MVMKSKCCDRVICIRAALLLLVILSIVLLAACKNEDGTETDIERDSETQTQAVSESDESDADVFEKGYYLPIEADVKEAIEADCKEKMMLVREIYMVADKGTASNAVIGEETAGQMLALLQDTGCPVTADEFCYNMANYEKMELFLEKSLDGREGEIVIYEIYADGGIGRRQLIFDGIDMYVLGTSAIWNEENEPVITFTSFTRMKKWAYTEKGYLLLIYCVPEPPEVSEVVISNDLIRVKPQEEFNIDFAKRYLIPVGYQGNNLFCSNWDASHLEDLDYNGLFEYFYLIEYGERIDYEKYAEGIPKEEFEALMMRYLPVTSSELREYAVYEADKEIYAWARLGCLNYLPNAFGTSQPEITGIQENEDGTVTLTVDAVCVMAGNDAVFSHKLTVSFLEDGGIVYLGNEILDDGLERIPAYQYRFPL